jgi:hypothetical protein
MPNLFNAYSVPAAKIPTYFIESTAPNNVDDSPAHATGPAGLTPIDPDRAVEDIAGHLSGAAQPNLVVMIHGFNNPQKAVLTAYAEASRAIERDPAICNRAGLVCVGYRWPSEKMGEPWRATPAALPRFPSWVLGCGVVLFLVYPLPALGCLGGRFLVMTFRSDVWFPPIARDIEADPRIHHRVHYLARRRLFGRSTRSGFVRRPYAQQHRSVREARHSAPGLEARPTKGVSSAR